MNKVTTITIAIPIERVTITTITIAIRAPAIPTRKTVMTSTRQMIPMLIIVRLCQATTTTTTTTTTAVVPTLFITRKRARIPITTISAGLAVATAALVSKEAEIMTLWMIKNVIVRIANLKEKPMTAKMMKRC
jgi:hypothetical protein